MCSRESGSPGWVPAFAGTQSNRRGHKGKVMMDVRESLLAEAAERILIKDGAYGTEVQARRLNEADYRGALDLARDQKGNNDLLNLSRPELVREIAQSFADAGADILATNTFNANAVSQADYGAQHLVRKINAAAARIVRGVAEREAEKDGRRRFVAGALGPTNKTLSLSPNVSDPGYREIDFDTLSDVYVEQIEGLVEGGAEIVLIETVFDTLNAKAAIHAARRVDPALPIMLSMTVTDLSGRNLSGHSIEAFWASVRHARPLSVGLNCSFGAAQLRPHIAALSAIADTLIMAYPNAGLPNDLGDYDECPATTSAQVREWAESGTVNIVGGCCGTTPAHIKAIKEATFGLPPRQIPQPPRWTRLAGIEPMVIAA
jgi:5-methyltetrahydrofolate--homocysteine methyltransferase